MFHYPLLGIDLGTCFSCVYAFQNGSLVPVPIGGCNSVRSAIYMKDNIKLFGNMAISRMTNEPENVFYDIKRFIGRTYDEVTDLIRRKNYQFCIQQWGCIPVFVVPSGQNRVSYSVCTAEVLISHFLNYLVTEAQNYLQYKITDVVITVPAFFQVSQINMTMKAATMIGLNVLAILYEPSAAALASSLPPSLQMRHVMVYDLGGGTFDLALVETRNALYDVIGNDGDPFLGGSDFDWEMCNIIANKAYQVGVDVNGWNRQKISKLQEIAEKAKIDLSTSPFVNMDLRYIDPNIEIDFNVTRQDFEAVIKPHIDQTIAICQRLLLRKKITLTSTDYILLVGGSSYIPCVKSALKDAFPDTPILNNVNPAEIVAQGAAWYCLDLYCSNHKPNPLPNPLPCPRVHTIVVHSVYVQFGNSPPKVVLQTGDRCQTVRRIQYHIGWHTGVHVSILTDSDDHQAGHLRKLDSFEVQGFLGNAVVEMQMNTRGELEFSFGTNRRMSDHRIVKFQFDIPLITLNDFTQRCNLLEGYKKDISDIYHQKVEAGQMTPQGVQQYTAVMNWFNDPGTRSNCQVDMITAVYNNNFAYFNMM